jgi:hypothetical protein
MVGVAFDALGDGDKKLPFQGRRSRRQNRPPATTATLLANLSPLHENGQQKIPVPGPDLYAANLLNPQNPCSTDLQRN